MTAIRFALPALSITRGRPLDRRWSLLLAVAALLGLVGGVELVEQVVVMTAQVLFIAFTLTFLITFLLAGIGLVRKSTPSLTRTGARRRSTRRGAGYLAYSMDRVSAGRSPRQRRHAQA